MSNPTTPFSWQMPTATDLVTDLPADFEVFGQAVATSMADLLGGTTGQVLAKTSATDMDFTWTTPQVGDITGVTAGTGISGGGTSGTVTVSIDTTVTADLTTAQILTNKTLTSPTLTTPVLGTPSSGLLTNATGLPLSTGITGTLAATNGGTAQSTYATGDIVYATAANTLGKRTIGSTGNVLTVAGGIPTWAAPASGGGMTLISTTTLSGASVTLNSFTGYKNLQLIVRSYKPASNATECRMQVNADATANRHATFATVSGTAGNSFNSVSWLVAETGSSSQDQGIWVIDIPDYANTSTWKSARGYAITNNGTTTTNFNTQNSVFYYNQINAITSLVLFPSTGNFSSGTALLYGVN